MNNWPNSKWYFFLTWHDIHGSSYLRRNLSFRCFLNRFSDSWISLRNVIWINISINKTFHKFSEFGREREESNLLNISKTIPVFITLRGPPDFPTNILSRNKICTSINSLICNYVQIERGIHTCKYDLHRITNLLRERMKVKTIFVCFKSSPTWRLM